MNMNMKVNVNVHEIVYIRIHSKGRCSMRITRKHINWHHLRWPTTMYVDTAVGAIQNGGTTKNHICHFGRYGLYDHVGVSLFEINPQICMSKKNKHTYIHTYIYIYTICICILSSWGPTKCRSLGGLLTIYIYIYNTFSFWDPQSLSEESSTRVATCFFISSSSKCPYRMFKKNISD